MKVTKEKMAEFKKLAEEKDVPYLVLPPEPGLSIRDEAMLFLQRAKDISEFEFQRYQCAAKMKIWIVLHAQNRWSAARGLELGLIDRAETEPRKDHLRRRMVYAEQKAATLETALMYLRETDSSEMTEAYMATIDTVKWLEAHIAHLLRKASGVSWTEYREVQEERMAFLLSGMIEPEAW